MALYEECCQENRESSFGKIKPEPQQLWNGFVDAIQDQLKKIPGKIEFIPPKEGLLGILANLKNKIFKTPLPEKHWRDDLAGIKYTDGKKKYVINNCIDGKLCVPGKGRSYYSAIEEVSTLISQKMDEKGVKENPFKKFADPRLFDDEGESLL